MLSLSWLNFSGQWIESPNCRRTQIEQGAMRGFVDLTINFRIEKSP